MTLPKPKRPILPPTSVAFEDEALGLRVLKTSQGGIVEVLEGYDYLDNPRWRRASLTPLRPGNELPTYEGWKSISGALGVKLETTARRYAMRPRDPLPVRRRFDGTPWIFQVTLQAWVAANGWSELSYPLVAEERLKGPKTRKAYKPRAA